MNHKYLFFISIWGIQTALHAQQDHLIEKSTIAADSILNVTKPNLFTKEASYIGDFASNINGGEKTGVVYLGMANIKIGIETNNLNLWQGGEFFINGACTHGEAPSEKLFGDFQVASNIEAGNHIFVQELWYKQSFTNFDITLGLQDLNSEFVSSEFAGSFINSSFGIPSLISNNVPVPIFPLTALGISTKLQLNESFSIQTALFDGLPENFEKNPYNLQWDLNRNNGALLFSEAAFSTRINGLSGTYKAGGYYHSSLKENSTETGMDETVFSKNYGFYIIGDQTVWQKNENKSLGIFIQLAASPSSINLHNYYIGCGINYKGLFDNNPDNIFGIAAAHANFNSRELKDETTIEMFYKSFVSESLFLQPDFQYIINPAGEGKNLPNATAFFLRFGFNI